MLFRLNSDWTDTVQLCKYTSNSSILVFPFSCCELSVTQDRELANVQLVTELSRCYQY